MEGGHVPAVQAQVRAVGGRANRLAREGEALGRRREGRLRELVREAGHERLGRRQPGGRELPIAREGPAVEGLVPELLAQAELRAARDHDVSEREALEHRAGGPDLEDERRLRLRDDLEEEILHGQGRRSVAGLDAVLVQVQLRFHAEDARRADPDRHVAPQPPRVGGRGVRADPVGVPRREVPGVGLPASGAVARGEDLGERRHLVDRPGDHDDVGLRQRRVRIAVRDRVGHGRQPVRERDRPGGEGGEQRVGRGAGSRGDRRLGRLLEPLDAP